MLLPKYYPVTCHTDHVGQGSTFVAIKGFATDGARLIPKALANGATHIITHYESNKDSVEKLCSAYGASCSFAADTRQTLAEEANKSLGYPAQSLRIIGVTGTKGKTTTAYLIEHILKTAGYKTALISTVANRIMNEEEESQRTTPESDYLFMFFAECVKRGVQYVIMEVSSHALSLQRVHSIPFDVACFTNLTPEHMDYHPTLEDYFATKMKLFPQVKPTGTIVINGDDDWAIKAYKHAIQTLPAAQVITMSKHESTAPSYASTFTPTQTSFEGIACSLHVQNTDSFQFSCPALTGIYNCYNTSMAASATQALGISQESITNAFSTFKGVPGRLQKHVLKNGAVAFVDFAHNSSSFKEVLTALRPYTKDLIIVFGCGGNKDKTKRPVMGNLATAIGDRIILTDDNPRNEDRHAIIRDILTGIISENKHKVIMCQPDRDKAIAHAAAISQKGSIIALLGKGHETLYLVGNESKHFSDFEEISKF